jgi:hypothetical protein
MSQRCERDVTKDKTSLEMEAFIHESLDLVFHRDLQQTCLFHGCVIQGGTERTNVDEGVRALLHLR